MDRVGDALIVFAVVAPTLAGIVGVALGLFFGWLMFT